MTLIKKLPPTKLIYFRCLQLLFKICRFVQILPLFSRFQRKFWTLSSQAKTTQLKHIKAAKPATLRNKIGLTANGQTITAATKKVTQRKFTTTAAANTDISIHTTPTERERSE